MLETLDRTTWIEKAEFEEALERTLPIEPPKRIGKHRLEEDAEEET